MQDVSPYEPPGTDIHVLSELDNPNKNRIAAKVARAAAVTFFSLLGSVLGLVAGFYGGFAVFGDAGDFTMMFVAPCILIGVSVGAALGAVGGALLGRSITTNS